MRTLLDFVLDEPLGEGSNAVVHKARRLPGGETVALKCPRHETAAASASLEREARLLGRLRHPNVARLIELVRLSDSDPVVGLAVELIDGPTLLRLSQTAPIDPSHLAAVGADVARGLEALHDVGIIHGDVKPANVVIRPSGQAVLIDLDAAIDETEKPVESQVVRTTTRFAAPEVLDRGERTNASDVWSLAACLLACAEPEDGATATPDLPVAMRELLDASLAADPAARPTLTEIIDGLDRMAKVTPPSADDVIDPRETAIAYQPGTQLEDGASPPRFDDSVGDPTVVWRPARGRPADVPRPPAKPPRAAPPATRVRIGLTVAGVVLGAFGIIGLLGWITDAVRGPQPTLASPPDAGTTRAEGSSLTDLDPTLDQGGDEVAGPGPTSTTQSPEPASAPPCAHDATTPRESAGPSSEVRQIEADLLGEGCARTVAWDPVTARATVSWPDGPRRYAFGRPGDQLVLGDWDADGKATPALYRPSTGETFTFSGWAEPDAPLPSAEVQDTGIRDGRAIARTAVAGTADQLIVEAGS